MKQFLLLILVSFFYCACFSQTTLYQKKVIQIQKKYLKIIGVKNNYINAANTSEEIKFLWSNAIHTLSPREGFALELMCNKEIIAASKYKNNVDYRRDEEASGNQKRIQQEEDEKNKIKAQDKIRIQKENDEIKERQIQQQNAIQRIQNSDFYIINNTLKIQVKNWVEKGEFEKSEDYQKRISNNFSKAFDSICYSICIDAIIAKSGFSSKLLKYNADSEKFGIEFNFNSIIFYDSISMPVNQASKFKDEIENFEIYVYNKDWGFNDNYLTPTKIRYYNNQSKQNFEFFFSTENLKLITISSSELGLELSKNVNSEFNFNEFYYNHIFETKDGSAINTFAWDCLLNKKFLKALQILEKGILLINKNDETYPYLLSNLAHAYLFNNEFDKAHKIYIENLQTKLNEMTWENAILEDFMEFGKRGIKSPEMEKIKQELFVLNTNIEKEKLSIKEKQKLEKLNIIEKQKLIDEGEEKKKVEAKIKAEKKAKRIRTFNKIISIGAGG